MPEVVVAGAFHLEFIKELTSITGALIEKPGGQWRTREGYVMGFILAICKEAATRGEEEQGEIAGKD